MPKKMSVQERETEVEFTSRSGLSDAPPIVREHLDSTWTVHYPEEGFIPTRPNEKWPLTDSYWPGATGEDPHDLEAAMAHARYVTGREPTIEHLTAQGLKRREAMNT